MNLAKIALWSFLPALLLLNWCQKPPLSVKVRVRPAVVSQVQSCDSEVPVHPDFRSGE